MPYITNDKAVKIYGKLSDTLVLSPLPNGNYRHISTRGGRRECEISRDEALLLVRCAKAHAREVYKAMLGADLHRLNEIISMMEKG